MDDWATRGERMRKARGEEEQAMSDHAAVKDEHRKLTETIIFASTSSYAKAAQLLADFARDERLKEAELWMKELTHPKESRESWDWAKDRIEQLKRGEL